MKTIVRKAAISCGVAVTSAAIALSGAAAGWGSSSALFVGGLSVSSMDDAIMSRLLGGAMKNQQRVSVNWPAEAGPMTGKDDLSLGDSIEVGMVNLNAEIRAALDRLTVDANGNPVNGEKVTVLGFSAGSLVVNEVLRQLAEDGTAPDKNEITFVVVEDSSRHELIKDATYHPRLDYTYQPAPETEYDIIVITGEYDGMVDFPDRWWNGLAVANAMAGKIFVHVPVMFADLSKVPAENITVEVNSKGGTTTHYLVPTATLPLVQLFPFLKPREAELKAKIDSAYKRNDPVRTAAANIAAAKVDQTDAAEVDQTDAAEEAAEPKADAAARREARAEKRAEIKSARAEARAQAKADRAAQREARKAARAQRAAEHA